MEKGLAMRALIVSLLFCVAAGAFAGEENPATFDFRVVERIELACRIGLEKARNEDEAMVSLRWRNGALAAIVEIAYQATLAWLSERPDLVAVLESEQGMWLETLDSLPTETADELEEAGRFLHRRLAVFMTVTAGGFDAVAPAAAGDAE